MLSWLRVANPPRLSFALRARTVPYTSLYSVLGKKDVLSQRGSEAVISISLLPLGLYLSSENQVWCLQGVFLVRKPRVVPFESWGGNKTVSVRGNPIQHWSSWPQSQAGLLLPSQERVHRGVCTPQEAPGTSG